MFSKEQKKQIWHWESATGKNYQKMIWERSKDATDSQAMSQVETVLLNLPNHPPIKFKFVAQSDGISCQ